MMKKETFYDKSTWQEGPWQVEPDRVEFKHKGYTCLLLRHHSLGHFCGYVGVPPEHPYHGKDGEDILSAHGGVNYGAPCDSKDSPYESRICHEAEPGEPDELYWFGFDCAHGWDKTDIVRKEGFVYPSSINQDGNYRNVDYVMKECKKLAEQLEGIVE